MNIQQESLREAFPKTRDTLISLIDQRIEQKLGDKFPTREDFSELKGITKDLAQAQAKTEETVGRLEDAVERLAQAQQRTELKVEELAQAQQGTERELRMLARQVGGLSERLGGSLEDLSYDVLPACLDKYYDIEVAELRRDFIKIGRKEIEVNVLGEGIYKKTGKPVIIVGEVKSNITLKETKKFINTLKAIKPTLKVEVFTLLFGFRIHLDARSLAKKQGIHLFVSYGKEL
ncbi:MAG: hypothetical protein J7K02_11060 [Deltaproteobacteria bacterium]|nr:hypothetical protein [Deltaproteobacteria bacterium]